jgi:hypothetical protein
MGKSNLILLVLTCFYFLAFYIPDKNKGGEDEDKRALRRLIEKYGGILSEFHECFTYQLEPINDPLSQPYFF